MYAEVIKETKEILAVTLIASRSSSVCTFYSLPRCVFHSAFRRCVCETVIRYRLYLVLITRTSALD